MSKAQVSQAHSQARALEPIPLLNHLSPFLNLPCPQRNVTSQCFLGPSLKGKGFWGRVSCPFFSPHLSSKMSLSTSHIRRQEDLSHMAAAPLTSLLFDWAGVAQVACLSKADTGRWPGPTVVAGLRRVQPTGMVGPGHGRA